MDFSRDIVERCTSQSRVLQVPACGWSDLDTPRRVARTLDRSRPPLAGSFLDLAAQHARLAAVDARAG